MQTKDLQMNAISSPDLKYMYNFQPLCLDIYIIFYYISVNFMNILIHFLKYTIIHTKHCCFIN